MWLATIARKEIPAPGPSKSAVALPTFFKIWFSSLPRRDEFMVRALSSLDLNHGAVIHPFFANPIQWQLMLQPVGACVAHGMPCLRCTMRWCLLHAVHSFVFPPSLALLWVPLSSGLQSLVQGGESVFAEIDDCLSS